MNKLLKSSTGEGASMTASGVIVAILTAVFMVAQSFGLVSSGEVATGVENVGVLVASGTILYGLARKIVNALI